MSDIKLCKDCKFYAKELGIRLGAEVEIHVCYVQKSNEIDLVTGDEVVTGVALCNYMRGDEDICGRSGKLWEKKEADSDPKKD